MLWVFGGRVLVDAKPKYLNSPESVGFDKSAVLYGLFEVIEHARKPEHLLVVEGYMDVVGLAQHGIHYAVAGMGTAFTEGQVKLAMRYCKTLIFCFDGDAAGMKAAKRVVEKVAPYAVQGLVVKFAFMPEGHDPDSYCARYGAEVFEQKLADSVMLSDALFLMSVDDIEMALFKPEAKAIAEVRAGEWVALFPPSLYRQALEQLLVAKIKLM